MRQSQLEALGHVVAIWEAWRQRHNVAGPHVNCCQLSTALFEALAELECEFNPSDDAELFRAALASRKRGSK